MRKLRSREEEARKWLNQNSKPGLSDPKATQPWAHSSLGMQQGTILAMIPALGGAGIPGEGGGGETEQKQDESVIYVPCSQVSRL